MRTIHKYKIQKRGYSEIWMPEGAIILDALIIREDLFVYAEHGPGIFQEKKTFLLLNTGESYDYETFNVHNHIRTVFFDNGTIQHLYQAMYPVEPMTGNEILTKESMGIDDAEIQKEVPNGESD